MNLTVETLLSAGPIPLLAVIAWLLYRIDAAQNELRISQNTRDKKLDIIHADLRGVINRLAGIEQSTRD